MSTTISESGPKGPTGAEIRWFTTHYVPAEDRLRLGCLLVSGGSDVLWLTQRLANVLVRQLLDWLDKATVAENHAADSRIADIQHRMAQQAATTKPQKRPTERVEDVPGWLVNAVQLRTPAKGIMLTFRDEGERALSIRFNADHLRRWLGVVHAQYQKSGWPLDLWPEWITQDADEQGAAHQGLLH